MNYSTGAYHAYVDIDVKDADNNVIREYRVILLPDMTKDTAREDIIISNGTRGMGTGGSTTTTITAPTTGTGCLHGSNLCSRSTWAGTTRN